MLDIDPKLKQHQIMFKLKPLNKKTEIRNNIITSITSIGPYKNVYGEIELFPNEDNALVNGTNFNSGCLSEKCFPCRV